MLKAIETQLWGYRFRSRLEARWAVFFDSLGLIWSYEPEGFELPSGRCYLPDFFLPDCNYWIEIKGADPNCEEKRCFSEFSEEMRNNSVRCLLLSGTPGPKAGDYCTWAKWSSEHDLRASEFERWVCCPLCQSYFVDTIQERYQAEEFSIYCENCDITDRSSITWVEGARFHKGDILFNDPKIVHSEHRLIDAYVAARSARFEHGETPHRRTPC